MPDDVDRMVAAIHAATSRLATLTDVLAAIVAAAGREGRDPIPVELIRRARDELLVTAAGRAALAAAQKDGGTV